MAAHVECAEARWKGNHLQAPSPAQMDDKQQGVLTWLKLDLKQQQDQHLIPAKKRCCLLWPNFGSNSSHSCWNSSTAAGDALPGAPSGWCSNPSLQLTASNPSDSEQEEQKEQRELLLPPKKRYRFGWSSDCTTTTSSSSASASSSNLTDNTDSGCGSDTSSNADSHSCQGLQEQPTFADNVSDVHLQQLQLGSPAASVQAAVGTAAAAAAEPAEPPTSCTSSCPLSYSDEFIWECYFGTPRSNPGEQHNRPKVESPFAAFAGYAF